MNDDEVITKQMEELWDEYKDPDKIERRKIEEKREKNLKKIKEDLGL